ncbi:hypothetical protein, partial [Nocardia neocaledoniensis]|uniref:hypothetical protein n=1 Tax=Nocardia neocaledoniensis TaxID=236511 RepID=UPI00245547C9
RFDELIAQTKARWQRSGEIAHRAEPDLKNGRGARPAARPGRPAGAAVIGIVAGWPPPPRAPPPPPPPKPAAELVGLVYSETPKALRTDPDADTLPWYQRPVLLAGIALVLVIALNIVIG